MIDHPETAQIPGLRKLWQEAFGDSEDFLDIFFAHGFHSSRCRCITESSNPVAALYWFDCSCSGKKIAYLYAVATARSHRGQGLCHRLMENVHRLLAEQGYSGAILVPGEASLFDFYGKMGYLTIPCASRFSAMAGENANAVACLTPAEYAIRRKALLPANAVLQEGENLSFLSQICELYGGEGWVMAAAAEESTLTAMEFLGDSSRIPGILKALNVVQGHFRSVGNEPFAMYLPLDAAEAPAYFGLPFD